ncbi:GlmU [Chryseobacterium phage MA9V-2]|nr:GlmU [Chryseobacterium phage MA9V-2]
MTNQKFENLIIVASGAGTRMAEYTMNNTIPKLLVSLGNETIWSSMLKNIDRVAEYVFVIANSKHIPMLQEVAKLTYPEQAENIIYVDYDEQDGTANTIAKTVSDRMIDGTTLIVWSDILEASTESLLPLTSSLSKLKEYDGDNLQVCVIADRQPRHRFKIDGSVIEEVADASGNIVGAYATNEIAKFGAWSGSHGRGLRDFKFTGEVLRHNQDFISLVKVMHERDDLRSIKTFYGDFIDLGDSAKYQAYMASKEIKTRYFNKLEIGTDRVTKTATNAKGRAVMANEASFYMFMEKSGFDQMFAGVIGMIGDSIEDDMSTLVLEKLDKTVHQHITEHVANVKNVDKHAYTARSYAARIAYKNFKEFMKPLHTANPDHFLPQSDFSDDVLTNAAWKEYIEVTRSRYESIKGLLSASDIIRFNGEVVPSFDYVMAKLEDYLRNSNVLNLGLIHGDTNTANVMMDSKGAMKLIDPRGVFGDMQYAGDTNYDLAKFLYGLTGYTDFNDSTDFKVKKDGTSLYCELFNKLPSPWYVCQDNEGNDDINAVILVGLIWLKLPAYIINNPLKSLVAYYKGLTLLNKALNEYEFTR